MRNRWLRFFLIIASLIVFGSVSADAASNSKTIIGIKDNGIYRTVLCIRFDVTAGTDPDSAADKELRAFGARRIGPLDMRGLKFIPLGTLWGQFFGKGKRDDKVVQYYNPAGDVTSGGGIQAFLQAQA